MGDGPLRVGVAQTVTATRSLVTPRPAERSAQHLEVFCAALSNVFARSVEPIIVESYSALVDVIQHNSLNLT